jgi:hypothetical protein
VPVLAQSTSAVLVKAVVVGRYSTTQGQVQGDFLPSRWQVLQAAHIKLQPQDHPYGFSSIVALWQCRGYESDPVMSFRCCAAAGVYCRAAQCATLWSCPRPCGVPAARFPGPIHLQVNMQVAGVLGCRCQSAHQSCGMIVMSCINSQQRQ